MDTELLQISREEILRAADLKGQSLEGVFCLAEDLLLVQQQDVGVLGWLALEFQGRGSLVLSVRSADVHEESGPLEFFIPTLEVTVSLPDLPKWPGGPPHGWIRAHDLEEGIAGRTLQDVRILSRTHAGGQAVDAGILLRFWGPLSLLVESNDDLPMTLKVSRVASHSAWMGETRPAE